MFPLFLRLNERMFLDLNGPFIGTSQTNKRNFCLSVILFGILSVAVIVVCLKAYISLCRGLNYLLKIVNFILDLVGFLTFYTVF